jgi:hypothetical protein
MLQMSPGLQVRDFGLTVSSRGPNPEARRSKTPRLITHRRSEPVAVLPGTFRPFYTLHAEYGNFRETFSSRPFATVERRFAPANFSALVFVLHLAYIHHEPD